MKSVGIMVVGCGLIGRRHIDLAARGDTYNLKAIVGPSAGRIAHEYNVPHFSNLNEGLDTIRPDGVLIATPNALHAEHALACIQRRIPILIEKPIADTERGALRINEAAERANVPLLIGHHRRHSPFLVRSREIFLSGVLGKPVGVMASGWFRKPDDYFNAASWRKKKRGGGTILINLVHGIDDLRFMCGEIIEVQAFCSNSARGFEVEDTAAIAFRFSNGMLGTYILSDTAATAQSWEHTSGENEKFILYPEENCYWIAGDHGSLAVPTMRVMYHEGAPSWTAAMTISVEPVSRVNHYHAQLLHFADVISGRAQPLVSGRDAARTLKVTLAVAKAAATGRPVAC